MFHIGALRGRLLSASALASVLSVATASAGALPSGGHYVAGKGEIGKAGQSLTVKQSSTTGIIDWNSFSIGSKNSVTFNNGSGATLNRVTGGNLSRIAGSLHATGSLYLMNAQGVIVSGTGRVVTGGSFVASTFDSPQDDRLKLTSGKVVNRGTIVAGEGVTLAGRNVSDSGSISAQSANLQAANRLTIAGTITARNADGSGGAIVATAKHIDLTGTANLSASGTHGGTVLIGGDVHGGAIASDNFVSQKVSTAKTTTIAEGAQISADGSKSTGGNIVIWSDGHTSFAGSVSAKGQTAGGFSEISSHDLLGFTGKVDLTSTHGTTGTLLLDPENVVIEDGTTTGGTLTGGTFTPTADDSILSVADLEAALATASVKVTTGGSIGAQTGDITVLDPVTWSSGHTLTLDAYHSVVIDAPIAITGAGGLTLKTDDGGTGGAYFIRDGAFIDYGATNNGGKLTIDGKSYKLLYTMAQVQAINSKLTGNYALATPLNASSTTGWIPLGTNGEGTVENSGGGFSGAFEGLGNTITGLKINLASDSYVGLFGFSSGAIRDVGVIGGGVKGGQYSGELAGYNSGQITNAFATGTVSSSRADIGGLVGENYGEIAQAFSTGAVTDNGNSYVGGLVGSNFGLSYNTYASGAVSGNGSVGGLAGLNDNTIADSYATGTVKGTGTGADIGGFVGYNDGSIDESYESGAATGSGNVGGFVGDNEGTIGSDTEVFFNSDRNSEGAYGAQSGTMNSAGLTTAQMMTASSFTGWTFNTALNTIGFVIVDADGSLNNASGAAGGTTPMLLSEYSTNIVNAHQLQLMELALSADYTVATNFSASATDGKDVWGASGFVPIGGNDAGGGFYGTFDGNGHTISGLTIDSPIDDEVGLFGLINGTVENLKLTGAAVSSSAVDSFVGILGGSAEDSNITGVSTSGTVTLHTTSGYAGGLVGENNDTINASTSSATVSNTTTGGVLGGLVGENGYVISSSSASGKVSGSGDAVAGGLAGDSIGGTVVNSHASGKVAVTAGASAAAGGLIGFDHNAQVSGSYATGAVSADDSNIGGLIGSANADNIANSYATGAVSGLDSKAGGLVGSALSGALSGSHATGKVTVTYASGTANAAGGLVGYDSSYSIDNSYASGAVSADGINASAGGLVGFVTEAYVTGSHATGAVSVKSENALASYAGGLIGQANDQVYVDTDYAAGKITGDDLADTGGLIGYSFDENSIDDDYASGAVTGNIAGGLIGYSFTGNSITDSHASGAVTGMLNAGVADVGGLIGESTGDVELVSLYATGDVNGGGASNLVIAAGGLVGYLDTGTALISSYATGSVTGANALGGLVGYSDAPILDSYATGNLTSSSASGVGGGLVGDNGAGGLVSNSYASGNVVENSGSLTAGGGLVGANYGAIDHSFATGNVIATLAAGGVVGFNEGTLSYVYSTGSVTGITYTGGLVGANQGGDITQAYATGYISSTGTSVGGLIGADVGGSISAAYWDTQTSGQSTSAGGIGMTTAQLQAGLPKGFSSSNWAIVAGTSFPYLKWQFASGTPQVISGTISGETSNAGLGVGVLVNGTVVTPVVAMSSGANGYYYELLAPGTIAKSGSDVLAYLTVNSGASDAVYQNAKGSLTGFNLAANTLTVDGAAASETSLLTAMEAALGSNSGSDFLYTSAGNFTSGIDLDMNLSASSFSLNHAINIGTGDLAITAAGAIQQVSTDAITANALTGKSGGAAEFNSGTNAIADLGSFTAGTTFQLTDDQSLTVNGAVNAGTHVIDLKTVGSSHNLAIDAKLTGSTINLATTGEATESAAGAIDASLLNVTASTGIELTSKKNKITTLGIHTTTTGPNKVTL